MKRTEGVSVDVINGGILAFCLAAALFAVYLGLRPTSYECDHSSCRDDYEFVLRQVDQLNKRVTELNARAIRADKHTEAMDGMVSRMYRRQSKMNYGGE
jgi:hypothetical protein